MCELFIWIILLQIGQFTHGQVISNLDDSDTSADDDELILAHTVSEIKHLNSIFDVIFQFKFDFALYFHSNS